MFYSSFAGAFLLASLVDAETEAPAAEDATDDRALRGGGIEPIMTLEDFPAFSADAAAAPGAAALAARRDGSAFAPHEWLHGQDGAETVAGPAAVPGLRL